MVEFIKSKKNYLIALAVLFVFVSLSEATYSLFLKQETTDEFNYNTGLLNLSFEEDEPINLRNAFPVLDSEGVKQKAYKLTVKNNGTLPQLFDLKMISDGEYNSINNKYIKVKVNDYLPHTLESSNNVIAANILLYPNESEIFDIRVWLDIDTPNNELGKAFSAKITSSGSATYKTLDKSGANHPELTSDMLPVYYNDTAKTWNLADSSNNNENYLWYNYDNKMWANSLIVNTTDKYIFDELRNNDLKVSDVKYNNSNIVIEDKYLDIKLATYNYHDISNIFRIKVNDLPKDQIYILSNGNLSYYYDCTIKKFIFKDGNNSVISEEYPLEKDKWYILGYTYDESEVAFYANGHNIGKANIRGTISTGSSFKLGTNVDSSIVSRITFGDVLTYHRILSTNEIANNYKTSMNVIKDGLVSAYSSFVPMTLREYYLNKPAGTNVNETDINSLYVWIPRFKYMVWNATGEGNTDSYDAYNKGINIIFENGHDKSGTIFCDGSVCYGDSSKQIKLSSIDNGKYYTHSAFSTKTKELTGFWAGKYELATSDNECANDISKCTKDDLSIKSVAGASSWRNNLLSNYYHNVLKASNNYRIIKNTEWGAIAYLEHSKFGLCEDNKCTEAEANKTYISGNNPLDSTTGNIYGVFDMSGGAAEYTMGNYTNSNDINLNNALFKDDPISNIDYDLYTANSFILGDATKEISLGDKIWYNNTFNNMNGANNWIIRGSNTTDENKGIYSYSTTNDIASENITTRIVIR